MNKHLDWAAGRIRTALTATNRRPSVDGVKLDLIDISNKNWAGTSRGTRITFMRAPLVKKTDTIFTMGSCFAREISHVFQELGFELFPKYNEIEVDKATQKAYKIKLRNHMNHYNTFTIRYEFEHAFANTQYGVEDFIRVPENARHEDDRLVWQDPYRRQIYASSEASLFNISGKIGDAIRQGIFNADVYIITLGLTEVWRNNLNGRVFNQVPFGGAEPHLREQFSFSQSSYSENYENMRWVCAEILRRFPERKIIITVSPVALSQTFSESDVIVANTESKSILRAVAGELVREFPTVTYWPSYEIALAQDIYEDDGRHVTRAGVEKIVSQFISVHLES